MKKTVAGEIYSRLAAVENCKKTNNYDWLDKHTEKLIAIEKELPSGSGIDCGTKIDTRDLKKNQFKLTLSFHHMDDNGGYDGWTEHVITVRPCFDSIDLTISGKNRNMIKEYLYDVYFSALTCEID